MLAPFHPDHRKVFYKSTMNGYYWPADGGIKSVTYAMKGAPAKADKKNKNLKTRMETLKKSLPSGRNMECSKDRLTSDNLTSERQQVCRWVHTRH
jgi:hypothetical protein